MRRIVIAEKKIDPKECSYGLPWGHDSACYNFNMPDEFVIVSEINEIERKDDIETLVIVSDLSDYGFIKDMVNLSQLYIYSGSIIHDLDFVRGLDRLTQLYITDSHVESLDPLIELLKTRKSLYDAEKDPVKRLFMFIEGICVDSDHELDGSSLAEFGGLVSEITINRKRII